ncbi:HET domain-containing protein [Stachybotrys elegans]|uniref:HET domain-containing protein n=1 Tax=Stachybotrys elegans TaxID=80388 RepID=A0A8K0SX50_9HYPO|nr:HET domain-containing protein [Stachybotrys elegans]
MADNSSPPYTTLPMGHIRLLRIGPQAVETELGALQAFDLSGAPPYYALSHSWAHQTGLSSVKMNGISITCNPNIVGCVQRLKEIKSQLDPAVDYVWIDSICINQDDLPERSSQVAIMGKIYQASIRTLVWLGNEAVSLDGAWQLLDHIYEIYRRDKATISSPFDIPYRGFDQALHESLGLPSWEDPQWHNLRHLMNMRWFSRIWVIQEVVLSREDPIIVHRHGCYSWCRLGWVAAWLRRSGYMRLAQIPEQFRNVNTISNLRWSRAYWPLDALISITQVKFKATDQRDKLYGLLGLALEYQRPDGPPEELRPDYQSKISDVYGKVTRYLMKERQSLALMTRAKGISGNATRAQRRYDLDLSSWTPDLSDFRGFNNEISTSLSWIHYTDRDQPTRFSFPNHYLASNKVVLKMTTSDDPSVLQLHGLRVDTINEVIHLTASRLLDGDTDPQFALQTMSILSASLPLLQEGDWLTWLGKIIKTTTAEQHTLSESSWTQCLADGAAYLNNLLARKEHAYWLSTGGRHQLLALLQNLSLQGNGARYERLARNFGFDRAFLITSGGRMGLGPSNTRQEDTISVLFGGDVVYCIKKAESYWFFIGEAYVEGLMKGEGVLAYKQGFVAEEVLGFR